MTEDEYKRRRSHLRSINPMTADCPPDDELAALEERFVEQIVREKLDNLTNGRVQEYFTEADYENTNAKEFYAWLMLFMENPTDTRIQQLRSNTALFLKETVTEEAQIYVEAL